MINQQLYSALKFTVNNIQDMKYQGGMGEDIYKFKSISKPEMWLDYWFDTEEEYTTTLRLGRISWTNLYQCKKLHSYIKRNIKY